MSTSATITTAFRQQFHDSYIHALQQKESRFQSRVVDRGMINGSSFTTNNVGSVEAKAVTGRYQDKQADEVSHATRLAYMADFDIGPIVVDGFDLPKLVADPTYKYVEMLVAAANRRKDATIYRALLDSAMERTEDGGTLTGIAIPAGQQIAAGGTGFTKAKIIKALELFRANECDHENGESLYMAYNSVAVRQILSDTTLTSADFMAVKMLQEGRLTDRWCGFMWIPYERMDVPSANVARAVAWAGTAVQYGTGINVKTDVSENKNKRGHPTEAYAYLSLGAVRQDDKKVVQLDFATNV